MNNNNNNCSNSMINRNNNNNTNKKNQKKVKTLKAIKKRSPHTLEQAPEKIESLIPPSLTRTVLAVPKNITPSAKSFMDAKVARKRGEKKLEFRNNQMKTLKK